MLRLLRAEIAYNWKVTVIPAVLTALWTLGVFFFTKSEGSVSDINGVLTLAAAVAAFAFAFIMIDRFKTRRDRFHVGLPVPPVKVAAARYLTLILSWLFVLSIMIMVLIAVYPGVSLTLFLAWAATFTGILFYFAISYILTRDLAYRIYAKGKWLGVRYESLPIIVIPLVNIVLLIYFVLLPVPYIGVELETRRQMVDFLAGTTGTILLNLLWIGLMLFSIRTFIKRTSFLA
jgi:hypothetical protein